MSSDNRLSRVLSRALRHEPGRYGLELDEHSWVPVSVLVESLRRERGWSSLEAADVERVVANAKKKRHEIRDDRIRAFYGHSTPDRIARTAQTPPSQLFHGTSPATAELIRREGLRPMGRQFVHLSIDRETAHAVGARRGPGPVLLVVDTVAAFEAGVAFYLGNEKVWLADQVPAEFISDDAS